MSRPLPLVTVPTPDKLSPATENQWKSYLEAGFRDSARGILEFGKRMYEFQKSCEKTKGGSVFDSRVKKWLGFSSGTASAWVRIGAEYDKLFNLIENLPPSWGTVSEICALPTPVIEKEINPNVTRREVKDIVFRLQAAGRRRESRAGAKSLAQLAEQSHRDFLLPDASRLGIDSDQFQTAASLQLAVRSKQEELDREMQAFKSKSYAERYGHGFPDGSDLNTIAGVTALHQHFAMPLAARLEWIEAHGFNACVALGVPRGLSEQTYRALCWAWLSELKLEDGLSRLTDCQHKQRSILNQAVKALCDSAVNDARLRRSVEELCKSPAQPAQAIQ